MKLGFIGTGNMASAIMGGVINKGLIPANASTYMIYQEGIYVGYKYYETRYEDFVTGSGNAGKSNADDPHASFPSCCADSIHEPCLASFRYRLGVEGFKIRAYVFFQFSHDFFCLMASASFCLPLM